MNSTVRFTIFIAVVITIYSLLNYYFIKKNKNVLNLKTLPVILLRLVLMTVILTPVATIIFSLNEIPVMAAVTGFTGYSWLAFLFLFLVVHGSVDIILFIAERAGFKPSDAAAKKILFLTMLISLVLLIYGYYEATALRVERISIKTPKLSAEKCNLKILQISDVHFSPIVSFSKAEKILQLAEKEKPDLIVSTGDLLDRSILDKNRVISVLKKLKAPLGKYAVIGNHEIIAGLEYSIDFIEKAGFVLLRNRAVLISDCVNIAGVDDLSIERFGIKADKSEKEVLFRLPPGYYTILLKHQPRINRATTKFFDLQLSGHTHGGQIFPFTAIVKIIYPYICGMYDIDENTKLYVNRGTGTWGPPVRFLAPPEITMIEIKGDK